MSLNITESLLWGRKETQQPLAASLTGRALSYADYFSVRCQPRYCMGCAVCGQPNRHKCIYTLYQNLMCSALNMHIASCSLSQNCKIFAKLFFCHCLSCMSCVDGERGFWFWRWKYVSVPSEFPKSLSKISKNPEVLPCGPFCLGNGKRCMVNLTLHAFPRQG